MLQSKIIFYNIGNLLIVVSSTVVSSVGREAYFPKNQNEWRDSTRVSPFVLYKGVLNYEIL